MHFLYVHANMILYAYKLFGHNLNHNCGSRLIVGIEHHLSDCVFYRATDGSCERDGGIQVWVDEDVQTQAKLQDAYVWQC